MCSLRVGVNFLWVLQFSSQFKNYECSVNPAMDKLVLRCPILLLEGYHLAEFSSNTPSLKFLAILKALICWFGGFYLRLS